MFRDGDALLFSASDLNDYLACRYLVRLSLDVADHRITRPARVDPSGDMIRRKGDEHELAYLAKLRSDGRSILEIDREGPDPVAATREALGNGADIVFQAAFRQVDWRGFADFLFKVDTPSALGAFSYEPADTKLAMGVKPYFIFQLSLYAELLGGMQGLMPESLHVVLGTGEHVKVRARDFAAYFRRVRRGFLEQVAAGLLPTEPEPVDHCTFCSWHDQCQAYWAEADHLSLVAGMRRDQASRLRDAGISTLAQLAGSTAPPAGFGPAGYAKLQDQAALQLSQRQTGKPAYRLLPIEPGRGFGLLPRPDQGDIFFDMEGDPFVQCGLEYLWGYVYQEAGDWRFGELWAHSAAAERQAFETFVDFVVARRRQFPELHVYHYASYEASALKRLAGMYGTREAEVDALLRGEVLVDLYRVVKQGLRISQPSYSIKKLEIFYIAARQAEVKDAGSSIVAYEQWIETQDPELLEGIRRYNEEDCRSTRLLRDWLVCRRAELGELPWASTPEAPSSEDAEILMAETRGLHDQLLADSQSIPDQEGRRLMADSLDYHRREARPAWWAYFDRQKMDDDQLLKDLDCIGGLEAVGNGMLRVEKQSGVWGFRYLPQEHRLRVGDTVHDPRTGEPTGTLVSIRDTDGYLELKRGLKREIPRPTALMPGGPLRTPEQRGALIRLATDICAGGGRYSAAWDILRLAPPRVTGIKAGEPLQGASLSLDQAKAVCRGLDGSYLFIQGPPGAGKTFTGARLIVDLLARGKRVGVTALSHKAIHNLLAEVEAVIGDVPLRGLKKCSESPESRFDSKTGLIQSSTNNAAFTAAGLNLVAGTAWLLSRAELDGTLDYLFIDEAGQISIADALAMGTSARNLVLLGDPQQLPQVAQGTHPGNAGKSILEHLLGAHLTIPPDRGLFLADTYRMHPAICGFISEICYEDRLQSAIGCEKQVIAGYGAGIRFLAVTHDDNAQASPQEADRIAIEIDNLVGREFTDKRGENRPLEDKDILVVAPYNLQVKYLRDRLPGGIRVGTVDKFQGQEAPVVFFSMATSSGEDLPRNLDFLFSRNRLNVAISRAKCLAFLVASPRLLDVPCRTLDQMRMVNSLCRLVEVATPG